MILKISIGSSYFFDEFQIGRFLSWFVYGYNNFCLGYISDDNLVKYDCESIIHIVIWPVGLQPASISIFSFVGPFG